MAMYYMKFNQVAIFVSLNENPSICFVGDLWPTLAYYSQVYRKVKYFIWEAKESNYRCSSSILGCLDIKPWFHSHYRLGKSPSRLFFLCLFHINKKISCDCVVYVHVFLDVDRPILSLFDLYFLTLVWNTHNLMFILFMVSFGAQTVLILVRSNLLIFRLLPMLSVSYSWNHYQIPYYEAFSLWCLLKVL